MRRLNNGWLGKSIETCQVRDMDACSVASMDQMWLTPRPCRRVCYGIFSCTFARGICIAGVKAGVKAVAVARIHWNDREQHDRAGQ